jgi:hypothetical protein
LATAAVKEIEMAPYRVVAFIVSLAIPTTALAWGSEGHRVVAHIAADELTAAAKSQIQSLLGSPDVRFAMEAASTWADEIKFQRPETRPWHYVDIEIGSPGYNKTADCPDDDCVVAQIERDEAILRNGQLAPPVRAEALRFLIHFIGDLHQPLHCADNHDRGGNEVKVIFAGRRDNMHFVWDDNVVEALGRDPDEVASRLETRITPDEVRDWKRGSVEDWANETFRVAGKEIYAKFPGVGGTDTPVILLPAYVQNESAVAAVQLEKAGVRLAYVLNRTLR